MVGLDDNQMDVHALSEVFFDTYAINKPRKLDTSMTSLVLLFESGSELLLGLNLAEKG
jgi:hypothetical protein